MPLEKLYPPITYPVSRGTAKISPFIRWDHSVSFFVSKFESNTNPESGEHCFTINLTNTEFTYLAGHQIDGIQYNVIIIRNFNIIFYKVDACFRQLGIWSLFGSHWP